MNDRIRIYELARKLNVSNQDLIQVCRELGYDVKSHSSSIDSSNVGFIISKINKSDSQNKAKEAQGKSTTKTKALKSEPQPPQQPAVIEPPQPAVKPRVLGRYKKVVAQEDSLASEAEETAPKIIESVQVKPPQSPSVQVEEPAPVIPAVPVTSQELPEDIDHKNIATPEVVAKTELSDTIEEENQTETIVETKTEITDTIVKDKLDLLINKPSAPLAPFRVATPSIKVQPPKQSKNFKSQGHDHRNQVKKDNQKSKQSVVEERPKSVLINTPLTVGELSEKLHIPDTEIIKNLFTKNVMRTVNQLIETELAQSIAREFEFEVLTEAPEEVVVEKTDEEVMNELLEEEHLVIRPPVVTIMGHVDHGKTSLLDAIRQTKFQVVDQEAGGITQHIGAYHVELEHEDGTLRQIVFLDTPGHEAFTAMRARGAKATDIAILVVAADDGVMPQTIEAIDHAKAAKVPIIVAINKIDAPGSDPERIMTQLMEHGLVPESYGGDTVTVNVSAKKRTGLKELLEMILLVADVAQFKANPDRPAKGVIIEAELSRGRGVVATALVENGTLREGDYIVAGTKSGRVRALFDDMGHRVKAAGPSMPVEVLGLDDVPQAGEKFEVVSDTQSLRSLVEIRKEQTGEKKSNQVTLESFHDLLTKGEIKELNVIVKADVQGTSEAIADSLRKLSTEQVQVKVLRIGSGDISENDVNLASSSSAIIIGFNVQADQNANKVKESLGVEIKEYDIIYKITDDITNAIQGLIKPVKELVLTGEAEVRQIFKSGKNMVIAGCYVLSGKIYRSSQVKIERNKVVVYEGKVDNLKRFKDDVKEVATGFECGMSFDKFNDLVEGDIIKAYSLQEVKSK